MTMLLSALCLRPEAVAGEGLSEGIYIHGHETETFQPCGAAPLWVRGPKALLESLRREYSRLTSRPYEPVYVELVGRVTGPAETGFAAGYEGQFVIERVELTRRVRSGDCRDE